MSKAKTKKAAVDAKPRKPNSEELRPIVPLRVEREMFERIGAIAEKRGLDRGSLLRPWIEQALKKDKSPKDLIERIRQEERKAIGVGGGLPAAASTAAPSGALDLTRDELTRVLHVCGAVPHMTGARLLKRIAAVLNEALPERPKRHTPWTLPEAAGAVLEALKSTGYRLDRIDGATGIIVCAPDDAPGPGWNPAPAASALVEEAEQLRATVARLRAAAPTLDELVSELLAAGDLDAIDRAGRSIADALEVAQRRDAEIGEMMERVDTFLRVGKWGANRALIVSSLGAEVAGTILDVALARLVKTRAATLDGDPATGTYTSAPLAPEYEPKEDDFRAEDPSGYITKEEAKRRGRCGKPVDGNKLFLCARRAAHTERNCACDPNADDRPSRKSREPSPQLSLTAVASHIDGAPLAQIEAEAEKIGRATRKRRLSVVGQMAADIAEHDAEIRARKAGGEAGPPEPPPKGKRGVKKIADGGTTPHVDTCACGARIIMHRTVGDVTVRLGFEPVTEAGPGTFVIFSGRALVDPDPRNLPDGEPVYRAHVCKLDEPPPTPNPLALDGERSLLLATLAARRCAKIVLRYIHEAHPDRVPRSDLVKGYPEESPAAIDAALVYLEQGGAIVGRAATPKDRGPGLPILPADEIVVYCLAVVVKPRDRLTPMPGAAAVARSISWEDIEREAKRLKIAAPRNCGWLTPSNVEHYVALIRLAPRNAFGTYARADLYALRESAGTACADIAVAYLVALGEWKTAGRGKMAAFWRASEGLASSVVVRGVGGEGREEAGAARGLPRPAPRLVPDAGDLQARGGAQRPQGGSQASDEGAVLELPAAHVVEELSLAPEADAPASEQPSEAADADGSAPGAPGSDPLVALPSLPRFWVRELAPWDGTPPTPGELLAFLASPAVTEAFATSDDLAARWPSVGKSWIKDVLAVLIAAGLAESASAGYFATPAGEQAARLGPGERQRTLPVGLLPGPMRTTVTRAEMLHAEHAAIVAFLDAALVEEATRHPNVTSEMLRIFEHIVSLSPEAEEKPLDAVAALWLRSQAGWDSRKEPLKTRLYTAAKGIERGAHRKGPTAPAAELRYFSPDRLAARAVPERIYEMDEDVSGAEAARPAKKKTKAERKRA